MMATTTEGHTPVPRVIDPIFSQLVRMNVPRFGEIFTRETEISQVVQEKIPRVGEKFTRGTTVSQLTQRKNTEVR